MSVTNPSALNMAIPENKVDQIIGVFTGTLTAPDPGVASLNYTEVTFDTQINDTCLTRCLFSTDGGDTKNDDFMSGQGSPRLDAASFSRDGLAGFAAINIGGGSSSQAYTVNYEVYCYAKSDQGGVTPLNIPQTLAYQSSDNYEKVYIEGVEPITTSTSVTTSIPIFHGLGYVPDTKTSIEYLTGAQAGSIWPLTNSTFGSVGVYADQVRGYVEVTESSATIYMLPTSSALDLKLHYRIYLDD